MNTDKDNPYVGPRTFLKREGHLFFGREREARDLLALVVSRRLVLFYAKSGAGKSSLINTRLIPGLEQEGFVVLPVGRVGGDVPEGTGDVDNVFVFNLLLHLDEGSQDASLFAQMKLTDFLANLKLPDGHPLSQDEAGAGAKDEEGEYARLPRVLIVDQFEEILTQHLERWRDREDFFRQLNQAMADDPLLWVVLTLREDQVPALDPYTPLLADRLRVRFHMQRLQTEAALQAIRLPAEEYGRSFAPGVAEKLVENLRQIRVRGQAKAGSGQFVEPVHLQVVCYQLWEKIKDRPTTTITADDLPIGYVDQALTQFYEDAVSEVVQSTGETEDTLRDWFEHKLITEDGTRASIYQGREVGGLSNEAAELLIDLHVLRTEARAGGRWVELVHDRLVDPILRANAEWRQAHPLIQAALDWKNAEEPEHMLYQGEQLVAAYENPDASTALVREFLSAGQQAQDRREAAIRAEEERKRLELEIRAEEESKRAAEQAQSADRLRRLVAVLVVVLVLATAAAIFAVTQWSRAEHQRQISLSQSLAAVAPLTNNDSELTTLLAIEARRMSYQAEGSFVPPFTYVLIERALRDALSQPQFSNTLRGHGNEVTALAFSPDGRWLASGSKDRTVRLWDIGDPAAEARLLGGHTGAAFSLAFSPDGRWLVSGNGNGTLWLWDVSALLNTSMADPAPEARLLADLKSLIFSVAFSPDGQWLALGSNDKKVRLWSVSDLLNTDIKDPLAEARVLTGHEGAVRSVAFSPDGRWLASGSDDQTVRLWDLEDMSAEPRKFSGHEGQVYSVAFSPDGQWLASGGEDKMTQLWDVAAVIDTGMEGPVTEARELTGHEARIWSLAFSPDGRSLATGSYDRAVLVWDMEDLSTDPRKLSGHGNWIKSVAYSPDGRWLASGSGDDTIRLWYMDNPAAGARILDPESPLTSLTLSPDGRWLASGRLDKTVRLWDMEDSTLDAVVLTGHEGAVRSVAYSPDGRWLASGSIDQTVRLWAVGDLSDPNVQEPVVLSGHGGTVWSVAFSPDGHWLASADDDGMVLLWDVSALLDRSTDGPVAEVQSLGGHEGAVRSVAFSPDGRWLASGGEDTTVRLWDVSALLNSSTADPAIEAHVLRGHAKRIRALAFSPDGRWLASGGGDETVRLWDLENLSTTPRVLGDHEGEVLSVAFSPDGQWLASGSEDRTVRLWDLEDQPAAPRVLRGHSDWVYAVSFSPDGQSLVSGSRDRTVRLWDIAGPAAEGHLVSGHRTRFTSVAFSPDGRQLASGSTDETVRLWDVTNPAVEPHVLDEHKDWIWSVAYSSDGRWLASGSKDQTIRLWDLEDLSTAPRVLRGHKDQVLSVAFSPDGRWLASGSIDHTVRLWDLENPTAEARVLTDHKDSVWSVAFSPDSRWLASGGDDHTVRLWDLENLWAAPRVLSGHNGVAWSVAFSPDGRWLASGSSDRMVRLWDVSDLLSTSPEDAAVEPQVLRGHEDQVLSLAFSPDGRWLASGSIDQTVRLWDLEDPTAEARVLTGHEDWIWSVTFSPDGTWLASGSRDSTVRLWIVSLEELVQIGCKKVRRNLSRAEWDRYLPGERYRKTCDQWPLETPTPTTQ